MDKEEFIDALKDKGILLSDKQIKQFDDYYHLLIEWNDKINLTAITEEGDVYLKHFYDSLTPAFSFDFNHQILCDIGSGAGFPAIPLKIVYPDLKITVIDSVNKKINFVNHLISELDLKGVQTIVGRAEQHDKREYYDIVIARAVARLNILDELCLPLVKKEGYFIAQKGKKADEEIKEAQKGIKKLGGKIVKQDTFNLLENDDARSNIFIQKEKNTSRKYPRDYARIKKKPL